MVRIYEPRFEGSESLFIIWRHYRDGSRDSILATVDLQIAHAAWPLAVEKNRNLLLQMQKGAWIIQKHQPEG